MIGLLGEDLVKLEAARKIGSMSLCLCLGPSLCPGHGLGRNSLVSSLRAELRFETRDARLWAKTTTKAEAEAEAEGKTKKLRLLVNTNRLRPQLAL